MRAEVEEDLAKSNEKEELMNTAVMITAALQ